MYSLVYLNEGLSLRDQNMTTIANTLKKKNLVLYKRKVLVRKLRTHISSLKIWKKNHTSVCNGKKFKGRLQKRAQVKEDLCCMV